MIEVKLSGFRLDKTQPVSLLNAFKNIERTAKACPWSPNKGSNCGRRRLTLREKQEETSNALLVCFT